MTAGMSKCASCARLARPDELSDWDYALAKISELPSTYNRESLREVKRLALKRKWMPRLMKPFSLFTPYRFRLRSVRLRFGSYLALATGVLLIASGVLPWVKVNVSSFHMNLGASDIYDWLSIYTIGGGLLLITGTLQRFPNLRSLIGASILTTIGLSAYIWSQVSSLLNLVSGFGGLFSDEAAGINVGEYLKPELGLWLWAGSVVTGILAYLARDL
jgi:hypothetical protein